MSIRNVSRMRCLGFDAGACVQVGMRVDSDVAVQVSAKSKANACAVRTVCTGNEVDLVHARIVGTAALSVQFEPEMRLI